MTAHVRHRRSTVATDPFTSPMEIGELAVNTANRQIAMGNAGGAPLPVVAVRYFDVNSQYAPNDFAVQGGDLYAAKAAIPPGAFNPAQWVLKSHIASDPTDLQNYLLKSGGVDQAMTGPLLLWGPPVADLEATTKKYVDDNAVAVANTKVARAGDAMTGDLAIVKSAPALVLNKPDDSWAYLLSQRNGKHRWRIDLGDGVTESGANAGSNFALYYWDDPGTTASVALSINRADGLLTLRNNPINDFHAATKKYVVDNAITPLANKVSKAGDTMSGNLVVNGDIYAIRAGGAGVLYLGPGGANYLYWDTATYRMPNGGLVLGGVLNANGGTFGGPLNANGTSTFIASSIHTFNNTGSFASAAWSNIQIYGANSYPTITFHSPNYWAANFGMNIDGNFYMGGASFGAGVYHKFITTRDGAVSTGQRVIHAGDFWYYQNTGLTEPFGANVHFTGMSGLTTPDGWSYGSLVRHRFTQVLVNGAWTTVGAAS